jgi:hypothetical protein
VNPFNVFAKALVASYHGRIRTCPNGYEFGDGGTTNCNGVHFKSRPDKSGRMIRSKLNVLHTYGRCPQPPGDYPVTDRGAWVPMTVCRKCPNHIKRRRRQPYPCCKVLRENAQKGPTPIEQFEKVVQGVVEKTKEVIK